MNLKENWLKSGNQKKNFPKFLLSINSLRILKKRKDSIIHLDFIHVKNILNNSKNDDENKQVTIFEILSEQQEKENEKEFIILKIYKSEINKTI